MYIAVENVWVLEIAIFLGIFMGIGASWLGRHPEAVCMLIRLSSCCRMLFTLISDSFIRRPSATLLSAHQRRVDVQRQLAEVKSVQLEFVKHSMLSRELIKADKAVEAAASGDALQLASRLSLVNKAKVRVAFIPHPYFASILIGHSHVFVIDCCGGCLICDLLWSASDIDKYERKYIPCA
jgi:hypothetical protein